MNRRLFLKLSAIGSAGCALAGCGEQTNRLIRFIPDETLTPGVAVWKPAVCAQCAAGCGAQVRIMEGDAEVVRDGQLGVVKMGLAKKLEGNPQHPVSRGKLCLRGEASLQVTYNPDRIQQPLKRLGQRGSGQFAPISWDEALEDLAKRLQSLASPRSTQLLAFLARPFRGQRRLLIERFLAGFQGAEFIPFELFDDSVVRTANRISFGYDQLPTFDLAHSGYVFSFGCDILGTWNSPVAQSAAYGTMRQNRSGIRGKFVQAEPRMSQTGANADEWVPVHPGSEGHLALGLAHVILNEHLRPAEAAGVAGMRIDGWREGLPDYSPDAIAWKTGVAPEAIARLAREMVAQPPAVAVVGGAPLAQTNGMFTALAVNALNALLGSVGKPGGLQFAPQLSLSPSGSPETYSRERNVGSVRSLAQQILSGQQPVEMLFLYEANPVFATPPGWQARGALEKVPFIVSFGSFIDETSSLADLILPDHSNLESWIDDVPESGTMEAVVSIAPPAMHPIHNTRAMPDVLLDLARRLGGRISQELPWKSYEEMIQRAVAPLFHHPGSVQASDADDFWNKVQEQGGWWSEDASIAPKPKAQTNATPPIKNQDPRFDGPSAQYPFYFLPYASQQFLDGRLANLPWMQEMPEVLSTAMWGTWVEINPQTAAGLKIEQGDLLEVASPHGRVRAPALLSPGIAPDVIAMPVGQGHTEYGRYASGRGANPIQILTPQVEPTTGSQAWAATRVSVSRIGRGELVLMSGGPTEWIPEEVGR